MSFSLRIFLVCVAFAAIGLAVGAPPACREWCNHCRRSLEERCQELRSNRRWSELQVLADRWKNWDSLNGEAWMYRAQAASGREDWEAAAASFWSVPDSDPHVVPAMIELSKLAFNQLNNPFKAIDACERILRIDPHAVGAQKQLIGFYATTLQRGKLLRQIQYAINAQTEPPESYVYYFLLNTVRSKIAVELTEHWLQATPDDELFLVAHVLNLPDPKIDSSDIPAPNLDGELSIALGGESKLERIDKLLERFPHNIELIVYKTEERFIAGDISGASELLKRAPDVAAKDNRFWRFKGWLHESNGDIEEAASAYRRSLELHSVDWITMNRLAAIERRRQNISEVERLTLLVERANLIRQELRKLDSIEFVPLKTFSELADYFRDCGEREVGPALHKRLANRKLK